MCIFFIHLPSHVDGDEKFIKQYNDHYFLTDPKTFIFDHFPQVQYIDSIPLTLLGITSRHIFMILSWLFD